MMRPLSTDSLRAMAHHSQHPFYFPRSTAALADSSSLETHKKRSRLGISAPARLSHNPIPH